jgi:hypothetical protein
MWHAWEWGETCTGFWWESPKEKRPLGRPRSRFEDGIKLDLGEFVWRLWSGFTWLGIGTLAGCCECGDEPSGSGAAELVS